MDYALVIAQNIVDLFCDNRDGWSSEIFPDFFCVNMSLREPVQLYFIHLT